MTSQFPPAAVPGPEDADDAKPHTQPDPFGDETDEEGAAGDRDDSPEERPKDDPRGE